MTFTVCWLIGGLYLDGWAHSHGKADSTFFTPWHAVLYSGYAASAAVLIGTMLINRAHGYGWQRLLPAGYGAARMGVVLFAIAGAGDLVWHTVFGIEANTDALLSPTHLVLAFSGAMIVTGPFYAAWQRLKSDAPGGLFAFAPVLLPITAFLSMLTFFTNFANPLIWPLASKDFGLSSGLNRYLTINMGVTAMLFQSAILAGVVLLLIRRWRLPFGSFALIFTINAALISVFGDTYRFIPGALLAGLLVDVVYWQLKPSVNHVAALRLFIFLVPILFFGVYMLTLVVTGGVNWSVHMALGTPIMGGLVGLMLSYLVVPPTKAAD